MTPYFERDGITIYHGDCRDVLPRLGAGSVDLVLTDPPYGIGYVTAWRSRTHPLAARIVGDESLGVLADAIPELDRVLSANRHAYIFAAPIQVSDVARLLPDGWTVKNVLAWDKGDSGTVGDLLAGYGQTWEAVVYTNKGRREFNGPRPRATLRWPWSSTRDPVHPTVKPVGLLVQLIARSSNASELVLDPFMGSGTTLRAALDLGRRAIGIEIEERYCEIAARRLDQLVLPFEVVA